MAISTESRREGHGFWKEIAIVVSLEDAQAHLAYLIAKAAPGEEIVITRDDKPVAR